MERVSTSALVKLADDIRALTLRFNAVKGLSEQSSRLVWACHNIEREYEGHTNIDDKYLAQVVAMKITAEAKVHKCDEWLAVWGPKLQSMVEVYNNQE